MVGHMISVANDQIIESKTLKLIQRALDTADQTGATLVAVHLSSALDALGKQKNAQQR